MRLPNEADLIDPDVRESQFKSKFAQVFGFLRGLLGADGDAATARSALGLLTGLVAGAPKGDWAPSTAYATNETVTRTGVEYICRSSHISSSDFDADKASGRWVVWQGLMQGDYLTRLFRVVETVDDLRTVDKTRHRRVHVLGYYASGDGGGGPYWLDTLDSTTADNGGTCIVAADGGRWKLQVGARVSVKLFGARGNGVNDDTGAIDNAHTAFPNVDYPPGTYTYNGVGIQRGGSFSYIGAGNELTIIMLGAGKRWIDSPDLFAAIEITGFKFVGGAGAIRSRNTGNFVGPRKNISRNSFRDYTVCSIDTNHGDCPYWDIDRNLFQAASSVGTIGIALGRNSDVSHITRNAFLKNAVHIKLWKSGVVYIHTSNDFIQFDGGVKRISVWLTGDNAHSVFVENNKFGNENQDVTDYRVAVLPELTGTYNGDRLPDFVTKACAGTYRLKISRNNVQGANNGGPLLYDVSGNLRGSSIRDNELSGSPPTYLLEFGKTTFVDNPYEMIVIEDNYSEGGIVIEPQRICNVGMYAQLRDTHQTVEGDYRFPSGNAAPNFARAGVVELLATRIGSISLAGATKVGDVTDAAGGTEAAEFLVATNCELYATFAQQPKRGFACWLEFDLAPVPGLTPSPAVLEYMLYSVSSSSPAYWIHRGNVPDSGWQPFRYRLALAGAQTARFKFSPKFDGRLRIGRLRLYQSRSPVPWGDIPFDNLVLASLAQRKQGVLANRLWVDVARGNVLRLSDGIDETTSSGTLAQKRFPTVANGATQVLWTIGLAGGYPNVVLDLRIAANRNGSGLHIRRRVLVSVSGTGGTANSVASVGTPTNTIEHQDSSSGDFTFSASVVSGKLVISVTPTSYVTNFHALGEWQATVIGGTPPILTEN